MKICIKEPGGPYQTTIDTDVMDVEITESFIGFSVVSPDGEKLRICMRDSGFEVAYDRGVWGPTLVSFQEGEVTVTPKPAPTNIGKET